MSYAFKIEVQAFVLMANHYHMIARSPEGNLSEAMSFFLRESSRDLLGGAGRVNRVFADRFRRSLLASNQYYFAAYKYIYQNPIRAGIVKSVEEYPYSTLQFLLGNQVMEFPVYDGIFASDIDPTLEWLNSWLPQKNQEYIRCALRKNIFSYRKIEGRENPLTKSFYTRDYSLYFCSGKSAGTKPISNSEILSRPNRIVENISCYSID